MTATNAALFRPCTSNAGPVAGGSFLFDRGQEHSPRYHQGLDIGIPVGTPLYASGSGTVISASATSGSGGWMVTIDYPIASGTVRETTMHHSRIDVVNGQQVTLGTQIGLSGGAKGAPGAGDSTGPHVHFEIHVNGVLSDPANYLKSRSKITAAGGGGTVIDNATQKDDLPMRLIGLSNGAGILVTENGTLGLGSAQEYGLMYRVINSNQALAAPLHAGEPFPDTFNAAELAQIDSMLARANDSGPTVAASTTPLLSDADLAKIAAGVDTALKDDFAKLGTLPTAADIAAAVDAASKDDFAALAAQLTAIATQAGKTPADVVALLGKSISNG